MVKIKRNILLPTHLLNYYTTSTQSIDIVVLKYIYKSTHLILQPVATQCCLRRPPNAPQMPDRRAIFRNLASTETNHVNI